MEATLKTRDNRKQRHLKQLVEQRNKTVQFPTAADYSKLKKFEQDYDYVCNQMEELTE